ncbi:MAG: GGDEF domain-containing protein [Butyrivibrio sp.]|uniref:bifunctional diguanylate cyclase/phosphodiesterase n=1 Tax=Butyrivibrio sp. TaxID=28121 RepID=UPI001EB258A2|nr:GGDEF domain-containing protein [Butyrivibrio sp.]MBE5840452.1 GGDEF domain-containing protein [Butyrivibrio sp.]
MISAAEDKKRLEQYFIDNIDKAIANEWIKAYHQPLIRAASGLVSDEEAFARWKDPDGSYYTASEFVPVLEKEKIAYKLDLYMVERVLKKMKGQSKHGLFIVPESVNLSSSSFHNCDMVKEILKRIDASGIPRSKLSVELSEKAIASDPDFMKEQVDNLRQEGIKVWLDSYGNGYSSLLLLLKIQFDLLKIDKKFVDQIGKNENGQIILTELIRTAMAIGLDTVAEGVENKMQADFLMEIGCTKLQGYYFIEPISLAQIIERNKNGIQIGFENPEEVEYFDIVGKVNLYDLSFPKDDDSTLNKYFDTMPMAIFEMDNSKANLVRCNKSFREFVAKNFPKVKNTRFFDYDSFKPGPGFYSFNSVRQCALDGKRIILDDRLKDGRILHLLINRIAVNPVTGAAAVSIVVLSIDDSVVKAGLNYNYIARALSEDYINLYMVNMDDDTFTEYKADGINRDISFNKYGDNFFDIYRDEFDYEMMPEDKEQLNKVLTKENVIDNLKKEGVYSIFTKVVIDKVPTYVNIKMVQIRGDGNYIIVGINNVDKQIKTREALEKAKEEKIIYSRLGALSEDYIYIFTVDPLTSSYKKYNPSNTVSDLGLPEEGDDFFGEVIKRASEGIFEDDVEFFLTSFTKENVFKQIESKGLYENHHRLKISGVPIYVVMRANLVNEDGNDKLIVGIFNINNKVKKDREYAENLYAAESKANIDELTGVKNKNAYSETVATLNELIERGSMTPFAIAVFDINGLKEVNDTQGHQAGDEFIRKGRDIICRFFKHSPVYRIGGDEFVVIVQGYDFLNIDSIMTKIHKHNVKNRLKGDIVVAAGYSKYAGDPSVATVFERADKEMYANKNELKQI